MILTAVILAGSALMITTKAQLRVNVNFNIGAQPAWGPAHYDYVEYYYLPDIDVYYHVPAHQFIYLRSGRWVTVNSLPYRYRGYDLYSGYKVVINQPRPYLHHTYYHRKYAKYRGYHHRQAVNRGNHKYVKHKSGKNNKRYKGRGH